jgi:hypothetical protein
VELNPFHAARARGGGAGDCVVRSGAESGVAVARRGRWRRRRCRSRRATSFARIAAARAHSGNATGQRDVPRRRRARRGRAWPPTTGDRPPGTADLGCVSEGGPPCRAKAGRLFHADVFEQRPSMSATGLASTKVSLSRGTPGGTLAEYCRT